MVISHGLTLYGPIGASLAPIITGFFKNRISRLRSVIRIRNAAHRILRFITNKMAASFSEVIVHFFGEIFD